METSLFIRGFGDVNDCLRKCASFCLIAPKAEERMSRETRGA